MERSIDYLEQKFRVRYFLDIDVRKEEVDLRTGEGHEIMSGDIKGVMIFSPEEDLLGSFDFIDIDNDEAIKKIIEEHY
ncbi:MAG: hypothetical protein ABSE89_09350 [Sedimentisphaerales bacterium]